MGLVFLNFNKFISTYSWLDHLVSGLILLTIRSFKTCFRCAFVKNLLKLANKIKSLAHYAKGTLSLYFKLQLLVSILFQFLHFNHLIKDLFHLSLTDTCTLSILKQYLSLESGLPIFR